MVDTNVVACRLWWLQYPCHRRDSAVEIVQSKRAAREEVVKASVGSREKVVKVKRRSSEGKYRVLGPRHSLPLLP
jgi:hypothetical protein